MWAPQVTVEERRRLLEDREEEGREDRVGQAGYLSC